MKQKTKQVITFIDGLHSHITGSSRYRANTKPYNESRIQSEIRPLILSYLENHFRGRYKDYEAKANKSFYWEGQEGAFGSERATTFGSRNYPDFIIQDPYLVAVEYKQSEHGSTLKHGIGQSIMHTLNGEFDFVYYLFHDQTKDKRIKRSEGRQREQSILATMWDQFNVRVKIV